MKKVCKIFIVSLLMTFCIATVVFATETIKVMEIQDQGDIPAVYVKGIEGDSIEVTALVGNFQCDSVTAHPLSAESVSVKTLILLDNSLSIPDSSREDVKKIVCELIAGRSKNEQFALATFGEDVELLVDFTDDYTQLKSAVEEIEFQDRETYLTDVLYDLIKNKSFGVDEELVYKRIFVVSDGVDNKSLGYTKEELKTVLDEDNVPIYTLGVYNKKKSNEEELSNMFALSRQTNADSFLLNDLEDPLMVINALAEDQKIIRFDVIPAQNSRDGSEKTITFNIVNTEISFKVDGVRMPQEVVTVKEEPETVVETELAPEPIQDDTNEDRVIIGLVIVVFVFVIAVITGIIILIVRIVKKKKEQNKVTEIDTLFPVVEDTGTTEFLGGASGSDGETVLILDDSNKRHYVVTLTDINMPAHSFSKSISRRIVIGRSQTNTDICIDYDKSISSKHCAIERRGDRFYLLDLQSSNGTYLNDNKVLSEVEIYSGCIIKLGRVQLRVEMS